MEFEVGDIIHITAGPEDATFWTGCLSDSSRHQDRRYLIHRQDVFRIPTRAQQPQLTFIDEMTPSSTMVSYSMVISESSNDCGRFQQVLSLRPARTAIMT